MLVAPVVIAAVALVGFWIAGGVLLRRAGIIVAILGVLALAVDHSLAGIVLLAVGVLFWLVGHWHHALRHAEYKSPLAQRIRDGSTSSRPRPPKPREIGAMREG